MIPHHVSITGSPGHLVEGHLVTGVPVFVGLAVGVIHSKGLGKVSLDGFQVVAQQMAS